MAYVSPRALALAIALLAPGCAALAAPLAACPQQRQGGQALDGAGVFNGPPDKQVELLPNFANLEWDLAAVQEDARTRGESVYLVCKYKGVKATVAIKLAYEVALCKAEGVKNRMVVSCSAATPTKD